MYLSKLILEVVSQETSGSFCGSLSYVWLQERGALGVIELVWLQEREALGVDSLPPLLAWSKQGTRGTAVFQPCAIRA